MKSTKTVLVAQRVSDFVDVFAEWIRDAGYRVVMCGGPTGPGQDCWAMTYEDCPLWKQADLVIYDPWIASSYTDGRMFVLERKRHPRKPVLLWGMGAIPKDVAVMEQPGHLEFLPADINRRNLLEMVERMIGPATVRRISWTAKDAKTAQPKPAHPTAN